ncbi:MAG: FAD-binding monooxygenase [Rhodobacteraceae bacterium]|nr:FAD-binding monooxygenase [Paracoccaceae bacterium]PHR55392.1 MAG: phenol 2-monooxygenase [Robiginitomaculum sp.]
MQFHLNGFVPGDPDILEAAKGREVSPDKVDVLISGCGPAGLCLAAQLSGFAGINTRIVEQKAGPMQKGQADGINLRSMEMFQAFGFAEKVKREAIWINETTFWQPDPSDPAQIIRSGRVQDVADGLSEMPHVLLNQGRVHDMYLEIMKNSPTRLEPDYNLKVLDVVVDPMADDYPVTVTLGRLDGTTEVVRARYVVGCDGARSNVRKAIGGELHGDAAHQAWGVMDVLAVTDFPDYHMKSIIQSANDGNILLLPREGGYLVRLYVELDKLADDERVGSRGLAIDDIIAKAKRILQPHSFEVKEVVWWSVYEIGHRLTDKFDDVPAGEVETRMPRVFTAGDACHTHSPKAGQGMNVSMGDTFNLGWKLVSVLTGRSAPALLHSYSEERRAAAKGLVDYDHEWSRVISAPPKAGGEETSMVQQKFVSGGRFTAGLTIQYQPSALTGAATWQELAPGYEIGRRFHSSPVIRLADAKPMQLGHAVKADSRWHIFAFAGADGPNAIGDLCDYLENDAGSPVRVHTPKGADIDAIIEVHGVYQQSFRALDYGAMPSMLRPAKGRYGLTDYEKIYCVDEKRGEDVFEQRGVDRDKGCIVIVRPDQYVAHVLPLDAHAELAGFFKGILLEGA